MKTLTIATKKSLNLLPTHEKMVTLARAHAGKRTYLSLHLWGIMDGEDGDW